MTTYLLAGGGTAGHVNPLLALAAEIRSREPDSVIFALGTEEGLESRLVPEAGFELVTVEKLPFPRKLNKYAITFPARYAKSVSQVRELIRSRSVNVVVGFGGYASAPAYEAAKAERVPVVIHEANALPGMANRRAAKFASAVAVAFAGTDLPNAKLIGMPLRAEIVDLLKNADVAAARKHFGLRPDTFTLLVTGGSLGAKRINETIEASRKVLAAAGIQILHIVGGNSNLAEEADSSMVRLSYCDRMDLAIAAADLAVARAGASTVSEFSALGLPAVYVPYPVGNGEQAKNAKDAVAAGAAVLVADAEFTPEFVASRLIPLASDAKRLAKMKSAAREIGITDATSRLYELVHEVAK
jgi:UDP-N-acetylglucosamine--N-acetylmuramyl-(pentapeptide) pyrophosphoryl-undecaprenol N-acetylglucosamine transferase